MGSISSHSGPVQDYCLEFVIDGVKFVEKRAKRRLNDDEIEIRHVRRIDHVVVVQSLKQNTTIGNDPKEHYLNAWQELEADNVKLTVTEIANFEREWQRVMDAMHPMAQLTLAQGEVIYFDQAEFLRTPTFYRKPDVTLNCMWPTDLSFQIQVLSSWQRCKMTDDSKEIKQECWSDQRREIGESGRKLGQFTSSTTAA